MSENASPCRVLITGASGYLGQFLVDEILRSDWAKGKVELVGTYQGRKEGIPEGVQAVPLDLQDVDAVWKVVRAAKPDVVFNLAAISSPAACEKQEEVAMKTNCPLALLDALQEVAPSALVVQLSTDQIFSGDKAPYSPDDSAGPVNAYGRSKLAFEEALGSKWRRHVILRSSLILGPAPPRPCARSGSFLHFLDSALASPDADANPVALFQDEVRSGVGVGDVVAVLCALLKDHLQHPDHHQVCGAGSGALKLNMGGPAGLSRVHMGQTVCALRGYPPTRLLPASRAQAALPWTSPLDISMKSEGLWRLGWVRSAVPEGPASFEHIARQALANAPPPS